MGPIPWHDRFRRWLAGKAFALAGILDEAYDVWLDDAEPRRPKCDICGTRNNDPAERGWVDEGMPMRTCTVCGVPPIGGEA